jgi:TolB-like protein/class 3 adenylate cyclase/Tfp pilus assembly protein PilF
LAAIVFTDVVNYSARMQRDETGTLALVREDFARVRLACGQHGGEVLNTMGDGLLLCFPSAVQAVRCALQLQLKFGQRRAMTAEMQMLEHRMGIHLGDVFRQEAGGVAGDGVNIAARLQTKAPPGGICISQTVHDTVKGKVPMQAVFLGPENFKNIAEPVPIWHIAAEGAAGLSRPPIPVTPEQARPSRLRRTVALLAAVVCLIAIGGWIWSQRGVAPLAKPDVPAAAVYGKSIAVLPFTNMSEEKNNAYFADGIHEDILTNLAHIAELKVVSRTSVMQYRETKKSLRQVAAELHVAYVLEGSVRREGNAVRVTGQLIRAGTDEHIWAHAYDRELKDIFAIQTALAVEIASALQAAITPAQTSLLGRQPTRVPAAYDLLLRARSLLHTNTDDAAVMENVFKRAESLLRSAVEIDPEFAVAWSYLADVHGQSYFFGLDRTPERLTAARSAIDVAVRLSPNDPDVIRNHGAYYYHALRDYPRAEEQYRLGLSRQPNDGEAHMLLGLLLRRQGKWTEALGEFRRGAELDPGNSQCQMNLFSYLVFVARRYEEAAQLFVPLVEREHDPLGEFTLTFCEFAFMARGSAKELSDHLDALPPDLRQRPAYAEQRRNLASYRGDWAELARLDALQPQPWTNYLEAATTLAALGRNEEARRMLEKHPEELNARLRLQPTNQGLFSDLARVEALLGHKAEALQAAHQALALLPASGDTMEEPDLRSTLRFVLLWTGDKEAALNEIAASLQRPPGLNVHILRTSAEFAPLHGDPRFEALLADPKNNAPLF